MRVIVRFGVGIGLCAVAISAIGDGWDPTSSATTIGSIANTRHNLTVSFNDRQEFMNLARNNYGEICIYCHTPHGANTQINAPLWNRTVNSPGNYTIYDTPTTLMRPIGTPGPNSLTCLSCHDGTIAIDSILNMPGSGLDPLNSGLSNNEVGTASQAFLNKWPEAGLPGPTTHFTLGPELGNGDTTTSCAFCHLGQLDGVPDYRVFMLGTDLRNDHPIGIQFPDMSATPNADFNDPNVKIPNVMAFFDLNGNNHADSNEVRLYDSGDGYEVECASCHDPHGAPSNGKGTRFNPSFLRVNNGIGTADLTSAGATGIIGNGPSALCLTCHAK